MSSVSPTKRLPKREYRGVIASTGNRYEGACIYQVNANAQVKLNEDLEFRLNDPFFSTRNLKFSNLNFDSVAKELGKREVEKLSSDNNSTGRVFFSFKEKLRTSPRAEKLAKILKTDRASRVPILKKLGLNQDFPSISLREMAKPIPELIKINQCTQYSQSPAKVAGSNANSPIKSTTKDTEFNHPITSIETSRSNSRANTFRDNRGDSQEHRSSINLQPFHLSSSKTLLSKNELNKLCTKFIIKRSSSGEISPETNQTKSKEIICKPLPKYLSKQGPNSPVRHRLTIKNGGADDQASFHQYQKTLTLNTLYSLNPATCSNIDSTSRLELHLAAAVQANHKESPRLLNSGLFTIRKKLAANRGNSPNSMIPLPPHSFNFVPADHNNNYLPIQCTGGMKSPGNNQHFSPEQKERSISREQLEARQLQSKLLNAQNSAHQPLNEASRRILRHTIEARRLEKTSNSSAEIMKIRHKGTLHVPFGPSPLSPSTKAKSLLADFVEDFFHEATQLKRQGTD